MGNCFKKNKDKKEAVKKQAERLGSMVSQEAYEPNVDANNTGAANQPVPATASNNKRLSKNLKEVNPNAPKTIKIVLVGDTSVGKTCLIRNYLFNDFSEEYEPTVLDVYKGTKAVKKKQIELEIHDTSGDENLVQSRQVQYTHTDIFIICVAVNNQNSCKNVKKWVTEIR